MNLISLFFEWYFISLPKKIFEIWMNFFWFFRNYFALVELIKTFLSPWKGIYFRKETPGLAIAETIGNFIFNTFSRFIGAGMRLIFICLGGICELLTLIFGILAFSIWIILPFFFIFSIYKLIILL